MTDLQVPRRFMGFIMGYVTGVSNLLARCVIKNKAVAVLKHA
jgi:hypothetical protein